MTVLTRQDILKNGGNVTDASGNTLSVDKYFAGIPEQTRETSLNTQEVQALNDIYGIKKPEASKTTGEKVGNVTGKILDVVGGKELAQEAGIQLSGAGKIARGDVERLQEQQTQILDKLRSETDPAKIEQIKGILQMNQEDISKAGGQVESLATGDITGKQVAGSALQLATTAVAGNAGKLMQGGSTLSKVVKVPVIGATLGGATGASSAMAKGEDVAQGAISGAKMGAVVASAIPFASAILKPVGKVLGNVTKGLASKFSGASSAQLDAILADPAASIAAKNKILAEGGDKLLEASTKQYIAGVRQIQKEASKKFGSALETLSKTDIDDKIFRNKLQSTLDDYGVVSSGKERIFNNVEFSDPVNLKKASDLVDELSKVETNGRSIRQLMDKLDDPNSGFSKYKTATSDERISYNKFVDDVQKSLKGAVDDSTGDVLSEANKAYSTDKQLSEAVQNILGKVKYNNVDEINKVARKMEGLFNLKGLDPVTVEKFFTRIGIDPQAFKAGEAVRKMTNVADSANTAGLSLGELTQTATKAVVSPEIVRDIAIKVGQGKKLVEPFIKKLVELEPSTRAYLVQLLSQ